MTSPAPIAQQQQSPATAVAFLHDVEQLRAEIESAMLCVSGNRLAALEESLWRQQVLCTGLKHLSRSIATETVERPLARRIQEASSALDQLNRSYAVLIQQSSQSNNLLLRLCRSYQESAPESSLSTTHIHPTGAPSRSWSCEA